MKEEEKQRKKELGKRLFAERGEEVLEPLSDEEVRDFFELSAKGRKNFYQYTNLKTLRGILTKSELWLTKGADLNDPKEFWMHDEMAQGTFVASFCRTQIENIAMWWMYGLRGSQSLRRIPVRIKFKGDALREAVEGIRRARVARGDREGEWVAVKKAVLCDVFYQYSHGGVEGKDGKLSQYAIAFDGKIANGTRCCSFRNALEAFPAYAKDAGWAYERESRLTIELGDGETGKGIRQIAIPFASALEKIEVCVGPGELAGAYRAKVDEALAKKGFVAAKGEGGGWVARKRRAKDGEGKGIVYTQRVRVRDSRCEVHFARTGKKAREDGRTKTAGKDGGETRLLEEAR